MKILVTGGAGFIGSAFVCHVLQKTDDEILNIDALTYAANKEFARQLESRERYSLITANICDFDRMVSLVDEYKPDVIAHFAAESHVDKSIVSAADFINTNIVGTYNMLEAARIFWGSLGADEKKNFRFHHVSTDEVFGDLGFKLPASDEAASYRPSSPYSASKAGADHLVRAWHRTYSLPILITNCSNNYGPYQFPEKLIPRVILNALAGKKLPVYGSGNQIRDWLFVDDHVEALYQVISSGTPGEAYNIGGGNQKKNIDVVNEICALLDQLQPKLNGSYADQIEYVEDRPGHDLRYAINYDKIRSGLGWKPAENFHSGLKKTVVWYLENYR